MMLSKGVTASLGSLLSYPSELLDLYSPSRSLRSSSDSRMLKLQRFNRKTHGFGTFSLFGPHIWNNFPKTSGTLLLSLPSKANSRHFCSSQNISARQHCPSPLSVCAMSTRVYVSVCECVYIYKCVCVRARVCVYMCVCVRARA